MKVIVIDDYRPLCEHAANEQMSEARIDKIAESFMTRHKAEFSTLERQHLVVAQIQKFLEPFVQLFLDYDGVTFVDDRILSVAASRLADAYRKLLWFRISTNSMIQMMVDELDMEPEVAADILDVQCLLIQEAFETICVVEELILSETRDVTLISEDEVAEAGPESELGYTGK